MPEAAIAGVPVLKVNESLDLFSMLIYGDPGVGKTLLSASADEVEALKPVLVIDIEGGTKTIRSKYPDIDTIRIIEDRDPQGRVKKTAWKKLYDVYEALRKECPYKTIIIDNLSEAQKLSMVGILQDVVSKDPDRDPDIPAMRDWGKSSEQVRRFVRSFRDLPCNVIFTAWAATDKDENGKVMTRPSLPGKLQNEIPGFLDVVLYMYTKVEKDEIRRYVLSQPTGKFVAKDRSGRLPSTMETPSMAKLADLILD